MPAASDRSERSCATSRRNRRARLLAFAALLPLLGGCVSAEELRRQDEATCTGYGFHVGTNQFAECLQRESLARRYAAPPLPYGPYWGPPWGPYWWP
jgi:hypothetical protein